MMRLPPVLAGALVVCLAGLVGCGDTEDRVEEPEVSGSLGPAAPQAELRVVVATDRESPPDSLVKQQFDDLDCDAPVGQTSAEEPLAACDDEGVKYSLEPARVVGGVASAAAARPQHQAGWAVTVALDDEAARELADLTAELAATQVQLAIVLDGRVVAAPQVQSPVTEGVLQISGDFTEEQARALADRLEG